MEEITLAAKLHVRNAIDVSSKGLLRRGRLHSDENGATVAEPIAFRLYLSVTAPEHRKTLAGCCWPIPPSPGPTTPHGWQRMPKEKITHGWWLCRFCMMDVEDTLHALLSCDGSKELVTLYTMLWTKCRSSGELMGNM